MRFAVRFSFFKLIRASAFIAVAAHPGVANAVEASFGLYGLGTTIIGAGQTAPVGVYATTGVQVGNFQASKAIPFGGLTLSAKVQFAPAVFENFLVVTSNKVLGGNLSFSLTSGVARSVLDARLEGSLNAARSVQGVGATDTSVTAALGWTINPAFSDKITVTQWLPSGRYDTGFSPNVGLNRFGTDVSWGGTYMDAKSGIELSGKAGFTYEGYNPATFYQSGNAVHFEEAIAKHFANGFKVGVYSYQYEQVTGDSGAGAARLGGFDTRAIGVGPAIGYTTLINSHIVVFSAQAAREVSVSDRLRQTTGMASITYKF